MPTRASHPARTMSFTSNSQGHNPISSSTRHMEESNVRQMMQKLESLEHGLEHNGHTGHNRWMVPYADLLTLLLGLFLVLFATQKPQIHAPLAQSTHQNDKANIASTAKLASINTPLSKQQVQAKALTVQNHDANLTQKLQRSIGKVIPTKDIEVRQQMRGVVISLRDNVLFAPGSAELTPTAHQTLNRLVKQLHIALDGQPRPIRVEGHTDNSPIATSKYPSNWELSTARATTIVHYLVASHQFSPENLSAAGYGEFKPLKNNSSIEGKQKNRRVDIVVLRPDMPSDTSPGTNQAKPAALSKTTGSEADLRLKYAEQ